ncbi:hypothetical protein [Cytobacillus oceanisediminis]|uniref:hypothetical protein n=1 Tax=Cytobacillus oceanisediminis TaxID=665099 RepID=UPI002040ECED|nr:hypothetical protein [Cytobacillus oceanisediminis]MCM3405521.1 hypothetical protein [Cytobacillus oceanisediminis]
MYLSKSEIVGSDKPVIFNKKEGQFTYDELINIGELPENYEHVGFKPTYLGNQQMFEKIYQKGE